ncbi:13550_t:CDS:2 [Gigaspora margarita]|uniref:13550_t:CDS:1 n=1 Tax=Gigaspora margarita TaxID=4874 RepID=A0ABM8W012_GIGMA|nr:13550_t:CDS:2 [Gigaspora margarita]
MSMSNQFNNNQKCSKCQRSLPYLKCCPDFFCYFFDGKRVHYCDECLPKDLLEQRIEREHFSCSYSGGFKFECYYCGGKLGKNGEKIYEIKNGKYVSDTPHKVPVQIAEEFYKKELGINDNQTIELSDLQIVVKKNDSDNSPVVDNSISPTQPPQSENNPNRFKSSQPIEPGTNEKNHNNGQKSLENRDKDGEKEIKVVNNNDGEVLIIDLKNIKKITLREDGKLEIEFESSEKNGRWYSLSQVIDTEQLNSSQELQTIKQYCQKSDKTSLSQQELNSIFNTNRTDTRALTSKPTDNNNALTIGLTITVTLIVGLAIGLFLKRKKKVKRSFLQVGGRMDNQLTGSFPTSDNKLLTLEKDHRLPPANDRDLDPVLPLLSAPRKFPERDEKYFLFWVSIYNFENIICVACGAFLNYGTEQGKGYRKIDQELRLAKKTVREIELFSQGKGKRGAELIIG